MKSIYDFNDYRVFLRQHLGQENKQSRATRGELKKLATVSTCHPSYFSRVLREEAHLSQEQAALLAEHFALGKEEFEYFMLLVQYNRAGNRTLKKWLESRLQNLRNESQDGKVGSTLKIEKSLPEELRSKYYSSWIYSAAHVASDIPELQNVSKLARALDVSLPRLERVLNELEKMQLIQWVDDDRQKIKTGIGTIYLERNSPWQLTFQTNWRMMALRHLEKNLSGGLNTTVVISHSREDRKKIEELFHETLEKLATIVNQSKSEELSCLNLDFFSSWGNS